MKGVKSIVIWSIVVFDLVFLSLPTLIILLTSFTESDTIRFPPEGFSFKWYAEMLNEDSLQRAFWRSVSVSILATLIAIPAGALTALALIRYKIRGFWALQIYFMLPFTVPLVVSGVALMLLFGELRLLGHLWPVGVALCIINLPFMIWAVSASVEKLDINLENAAANCGAPPLQAFFTVTLPAIMPGIVTGALLIFVLAINEFVVSLFLVDKRIMTLPVEIYLSVRALVTPTVAAISLVYIVLAVAAIWIMDKFVGLDVFLKLR